MIRLFVNAEVLTMDPGRPRAQAFAVDGDRIVAVGTLDELLTFPEESSEVVDLRGAVVLPGFIDPHTHFSIAALDVFFADCRDARDIPAIQHRLARAARDVPAGTWVRGWGYDHHRLAERRHPTRHDLDDAVPEHLAFLVHYSHHQGVANSRALAAVGIDRATPDPEGGQILREPGGDPAGLLFERAMSEVDTRSREEWQSRFPDLARTAGLRYARCGITAVEDAAVSPSMARRYAEARQAGALVIHVGQMMVGSRGWFDPPDDAAGEHALKLFVDGGYRCALRFERNGREVSSGFLFYDAPVLEARLVAAWRAGRRVTCHAIGNLGVLTAAEAIEAALRREPSGRSLVRIDHAMFLTPALITRLADLGIWVVAQPSFIHDGAEVRLPEGLLSRPFASVERAGIPQAFSSDHPCGSLEPLSGIHAAVTRLSRDGVPAGPEEAVSVESALRAYTLGAASAAGLAGDRGSLAVGKRADFVVLSANPASCRPESLGSIEVLETWVGGARVFPDRDCP
jgi:predicted amidohydrolase YtcJ